MHARASQLDITLWQTCGLLLHHITWALLKANGYGKELPDPESLVLSYFHVCRNADNPTWTLQQGEGAGCSSSCCPGPFAIGDATLARVSDHMTVRNTRPHKQLRSFQHLDTPPAQCSRVGERAAPSSLCRQGPSCHRSCRCPGPSGQPDPYPWSHQGPFSWAWARAGR